MTTHPVSDIPVFPVNVMYSLSILVLPDVGNIVDSFNTIVETASSILPFNVSEPQYY